jgi:hypothetical protein
VPRDSAVTWLVVAVVVTVLAMIAFVVFVPTPKPEVPPAQASVATPSNVAWTEETIAEVNKDSATAAKSPILPQWTS